MRENGWLFICPEQHRWEWNLEAIQHAGFADHVLDLMLHRFRMLPEETRRLLSWGACLGSRFRLDVLSWLTGEDAIAVYGQLQPALDEEFVLPVGEAELVRERAVTREFRFLHDRMQEAAYHAIPGDEVPPRHKRIADLMRERLPPEEMSTRITEIAGHMNLARDLVMTDEGGLELARLNLTAARRAKEAGAFAAGLDYLRLGMSRLPDGLWARDAGLAYQLYRERGELEYLNSEFEAARWFVDQAIRRERDVFRRADLYYMLVLQATLQADYTRALATAREGLALFGETLPEAGFEQVRDGELAAVRRLLAGRSLADLGRLPAMRERSTRAVMKLLTVLGPPCYRAHPRLWSVLVAREIRLCLEYGTLPGATYSYPAFGGLLTHVEAGSGEDCAVLYRTTQEIVERFADPASSSVGYLMMGSSLRHWFAPLRTASQDYLEAYKTGQASGNLQYAVYGFGHNTYCRYFQGQPLDELIPEALDYLDYSRQRCNLWGIDLITGALRVLQLLHGEWPDTEWRERGETEDVYLERCEAHGNLQVLCIYHIMRASALLLAGELAGAAHSVREAEFRLDSVSVQGLLPVTQFHVLKALVLVQAPELLDAAPDDVDECLAATASRYQRWRRHAPDNYAHWDELVSAERGRRASDLEAVVTAYDAALQAAQQQSCWPAAALIARRAESFWRERGNHSFADVYRQQVYQALHLGRAEAVLAAGDPQASRPASNLGAPHMAAVIHIAQALSLHTDLQELVPEIIRNVAHQTGAQRVVLLLAKGEELRVAMESGIEHSHYHHAPPLLGTMETLPQSVIRYVARAQRTVRFGQNDLRSTLLLSSDPYLNRLEAGEGGFRGTGCCVPLSYLGELLGVLYLENHLTEDAFDHQQEPLIEFLAAQAAISVRNIELIKQLAEEGRARREAEMRMETADAELLARSEKEERLRTLANTDSLTELPNRRLFIERLREVWSSYQAAEGKPATVLMLDIDYFKRINDRYGHAAGDQILCHLADAFRDTLRSSDLAARIGGEEFAILLLDGTRSAALTLAWRLCGQVGATPVELDGQDVAYTISVGVAHLHDADSSHESVLQRADRALYRAKLEGRNRVCTERTERQPSRAC